MAELLIIVKEKQWGQDVLKHGWDYHLHFLFCKDVTQTDDNSNNHNKIIKEIADKLQYDSVQLKRRWQSLTLKQR